MHIASYKFAISGIDPRADISIIQQWRVSNYWNLLRKLWMERVNSNRYI